MQEEVAAVQLLHVDDNGLVLVREVVVVLRVGDTAASDRSAGGNLRKYVRSGLGGVRLGLVAEHPVELILAVIYQLLLSLRWRGNIDYNDKQGKTNKAAASWSSSSIASQLKASSPSECGILTILASGEARSINQ